MTSCKFLTLLLINTAALSAQPMLEFDVVSIKPGNVTNRSMMRASPNGDRWTAANINAITLILNAYGLQGHQILGAPDWVGKDTYVIEAIAPNDGPENLRVWEKNRLRIQWLLNSRFAFKFHWETKDAPAYVLLVNKNGPKLEASTSQNGSGSSGKGDHHVFRNTTLDLFATNLSNKLGLTVINETNIDGRFNIALDFAKDGLNTNEASNAPSIFVALKEQLGLKLEAKKISQKVMVIEHIEHPSEN